MLVISRPGRLKVEVRVLLCFTYRFAMPKFWGGGICTFGQIGDCGGRFLRFPNYFLGGVGCTEVGLHR